MEDLLSLKTVLSEWLKSLSCVRLFATTWTVAYQASLSVGFSRQEYCHFLLQGIFLTQGSNPGLLHCRQTLYPLSHQGSPLFSSSHLYIVSLICQDWT